MPLKLKTWSKIGKLRALDNIMLNCPEGTIYGLVGPEWCRQNNSG